MATYYTIINDQFNGSSIDTNRLATSGSGSVSESGGTANLVTASTANSAAYLYVKSAATDGTPEYSQTSTTQVIAETKITPNFTNPSYYYHIGLVVQNAVDGSNVVLSAYLTSTTGVYAIDYQSGSTTGPDITTFNAGNPVWFRISVDSTGTITAQYSLNGTTWNTVSVGTTKFSSNYHLYPYIYAATYNSSAVVTTAQADYMTWQTTDPPKVSFTAAEQLGNSLQINFTDTSPGTFTAWSWDFGDGNTSTLQNPSHTYASAGTYTVSLSATDYVGTGSTSTSEVVVSRPAMAGISSIANVSSITF